MFLKICPVCGGSIERKETICRRCKEMLDSEKLVNFMSFCNVCGYPRISDCYNCVWCNEGYDIKVRCVSDYKMPWSQSIIRHYKFGKDKNIAPVIAMYINEILDIIDKDRDAVIVPVPCSKASLDKRGWDHMALVSSMLKRQVLPVLKNAETSDLQQKNLTKESRLKNSVDKYRIAKGCYSGFYNKNIIITDDILTTGATIRSAAKVLKENGFRNISAVTYLIEI